MSYLPGLDVYTKEDSLFSDSTNNVVESRAGNITPSEPSGREVAPNVLPGLAEKCIIWYQSLVDLSALLPHQLRQLGSFNRHFCESYCFHSVFVYWYPALIIGAIISLLVWLRGGSTHLARDDARPLWAKAQMEVHSRPSRGS